MTSIEKTSECLTKTRVFCFPTTDRDRLKGRPLGMYPVVGGRTDCGWHELPQDWLTRDKLPGSGRWLSAYRDNVPPISL